MMYLSHAQTIYKAAIAAVSPTTLVARAVNFDPYTCTLTVCDKKYTLDKNVKVVGFGKAVLGMATAVESLLGEHITTGVVSIPRGIVESATKMFPHCLPWRSSKIRIIEGGENNQPDESAYSAAKQILSLVREAEEEDIVMVLMSGGGSALLPYPVEGVSLKENTQAIKLLSNAGATINELNMFRKSISQTKGGKLAEAAYPAKVISLILSDVIDDPLDIIASGPTVPNTSTRSQVLQLLDKYNLKQKIPLSILSYLQAGATHTPAEFVKDGCYVNTQNVIIGNNRTATEAACCASEKLDYSCHIWSHRLQGEAKDIGTLYAIIVHLLDTGQVGEISRLFGDKKFKALLNSMPAATQEDLTSLMRKLPILMESRKGRLCLISAGEPTVTVKEGATGVGGRCQELALAYLLELRKLSSKEPETSSPSTVLACVGTDGQDGPRNDAAGAVVDNSTVKLAEMEGLSVEQFLENSDSHTFFSRLSSGKYLIRTGLTGTNVMDIHILLINQFPP